MSDKTKSIQVNEIERAKLRIKEDSDTNLNQNNIIQLPQTMITKRNQKT